MTATSTPPPLPATVVLWMQAHPGRHRPTDVANSIPAPPGMELDRWKQKVANEMARMARRNTLVRGRVTDSAMGPGVYYWLPTGKAARALERHDIKGVQCTCGRSFSTLKALREHQDKVRVRR